MICFLQNKPSWAPLFRIGCAVYNILFKLTTMKNWSGAYRAIFLFTCQPTKSSNCSRSGVTARAHPILKNFSRNFSSIRSGPGSLNRYQIRDWAMSIYLYNVHTGEIELFRWPEQTLSHYVHWASAFEPDLKIKAANCHIIWRWRHRTHANTITSSIAAKQTVTTFHKML